MVTINSFSTPAEGLTSEVVFVKDCNEKTLNELEICEINQENDLIAHILVSGQVCFIHNMELN